MSTATAARTSTPEEFLALPDRDRHELIDGRLVEVGMSVLSSWVGGCLYAALFAHCRTNRLGWVFPADIHCRCFPDPGRLRKPDASFVRLDRLPATEFLEGALTVVPDLVVEVLSPDDLAYEVDDKIREYLDAGVRLVWEINPKLRTVVVHRADGSLTSLSEGDDLSGEDVIPGFSCRLASLFPAPAPNP